MFSNDIVCNILDYINNNINLKITIDDLSRRFYFNKDYLMRLFKKELGITILDYVNKLRIYNSLTDLKDNSKSILLVGIMNGFSSLEYYSETFYKIMGASPSIYRKFINNYRGISLEDINKIQSNLVELKFLLQRISEYQRNRKRDIPLKLTIFK